MQEIAVVIVLLVALSYGGRRIYKVFRSASPKEEKSRLLA